jgi:DNA recombination protein RmuC
MFMPVESAFAAAVNEEGRLFVEALNKNIVIVTPSTLLATLRTISHTWRQERQSRNAVRIAREGGALYNKFVLFVSDLEKIGKGIDSTRSSYEDAMKKLKTGAGNLVRKTEILKALGAKTEKSLPDEILEEAEAKDDLFLEMNTEENNRGDA